MPDASLLYAQLAWLAPAMTPMALGGPRRLSMVDLAIVVVYLIGITLFGLRFRGAKDRSLRGYFLAGRTIPWWAIALSIVSAETSTLTIISVPGVAFAGDLGFLQIVFGYMIGRVVVAALFLPRYFRGEMLTAYQFIDQRFGPMLHKVTAGLFLLTRAAAEGVRVFAVSIVVGIAIGTGDVLSIAIISGLTLLYTFEGGMAAVVWTDVVQMGLYVAGTLIAIGTLGSHVDGGWGAIHAIGSAAGKFHLFHFAVNLTQSYTFWAGVLGGTFLTMASHGTDQLMVQRMLAARSLRESRLALLSSGGVILLQFTLFLLIGVGLFVFYGQHSRVFGSADRIFPTFIVEQMPRGVAGLLIAAILAAAMSNLSAALNSLSSTSVVDFWMHWRPGASERERRAVSRLSTVFWALVLFAIAIYAVRVGGHGHVVEIGLSIASVAYGGLLGVFLLGTVNRRATQVGAAVGMLLGLLTNLALWQAPGVRVLGLVIPRVAFTWYVLIGSLVTFVVGSAASLLTRRSPRARSSVSTAALLMLGMYGGGHRGQAQTAKAGAAGNADANFSAVDGVITRAIAAKKLPGAVLLAGHGGRVVYERAYGDRAVEPVVEAMTTDTIFDMASLTKCLVTATAVMQFYEQGKLGLDDPVARYLPEFGVNGKQAVTIRELLTHFSGLPPDVPLVDAWSGREEGVRRAMESKLDAPAGSTFRYSDVNFITLGVLVERLSGEPLEGYAERHIFAPIGMRETRYRPSASLVGRIAPTAHNDDGPMADDTLLRGTVHDPTTRRMGGVAGQAGVFSTAHDTGLFAQALLDRLAGRPSAFPLKQATLELMTTPQQPGHVPGDLKATVAGSAVTFPSRKGREVRGLGWDLDSSYSRPRGEVFPIGSFGHTGFTGTSMWMDPASDTYVVLLSNAIHPRGRPSISGLRDEVATAVARSLHLYEEPAPGVDAEPGYVLTGIDVLEATDFSALREATARHGGRLRLGLLTNQTGVDRRGRRTIDVLRIDAAKAVPGVSLSVLFSPEHGITGTLDRMGVRSTIDGASGLPVISLYGVKDADRRPRLEDLAKIDAVVVDLQDAGVRFYTYETVTGYFVEGCAKAGLEMMVLDRPGLMGGDRVAGPISDAGVESYTDYMPLPVRHGMTLAEFAGFVNGEKRLGAHLSPVLMRGWRRAEYFEETGVLWVNPSPNLRTEDAALLYPGFGLFEMTNVSVGRGSEMPFEVFGAGAGVANRDAPSWFHAEEVVRLLEARAIPGVRFETAQLAIAEDENKYPFHGRTIEAVRVRIVDRAMLDAPELGIEIIMALHRLYPDHFEWKNASRLIANVATMAAIERGDDPRSIATSWQTSLAAFRERRAPYLLYR